MAQTDLLRKAKSLFSTTLNTGIGTGTTDTITPNSVTGLPTDTEITLTFDRVDSGGTATPTKMERITGTISGGNLATYTRGVDSSTEQAHSANAVIEYIWNADDLNDMIDAVLVEHNQAGGHTDLTASTVVSNNSVAASTITASHITASAIVSQTASTPLKFADGTYGPVTAYTPAGAATATLDVSQANIHHITMPAGNITIAISNETVGQCFMIEILQDATGSRTVTWFTTIKWAGGSAPTLTTTGAKRDTFGFRVTGTDTYDGFTVGLNI